MNSCLFSFWRLLSCVYLPSMLVSCPVLSSLVFFAHALAWIQFLVLSSNWWVGGVGVECTLTVRLVSVPAQWSLRNIQSKCTEAESLLYALGQCSVSQGFDLSQPYVSCSALLSRSSSCPLVAALCYSR